MSSLPATRIMPVGNESGHYSEHKAETMSAARLQLGAGTGTCVSNAVTINYASGIITTEALSTAAGSTQAITLTCNKILAGDIVDAQADPGSSAGTPSVVNVAVSAGQAVILVQNLHSSTALNAAIKIMFNVFTAGNPN